MKKRYYFMVLLGLLPLMAYSISSDDEGFYAPWTKSKITNNTKYPIVIDARFTIPGCKFDMTNPASYCSKESSIKVTLKPGKTIPIVAVGDNYPTDALEGQFGPGDSIGGNALSINLPFITDSKTKKQIASNIAPIKIENPPIKHYTVTFDGKKLTVTQSSL